MARRSGFCESVVVGPRWNWPKKCGCRPEQINRWECGRSSAPRYRLQQALTKALGVDWQTLTRSVPDDQRATSSEHQEKVQLNVRIDMRTRNAFTLIGLRYGVQTNELIVLAPLLFMILAEKSLAWRNRNLDSLGEALEIVANAVPHLDQALGISREYAEFARLTEEDSVRLRDIFGRHLQPERSQPGNPFMAYLETQAQDLIASNLISYVGADYPGETDYLIWGEEDLKKATGLTGAHEDDDEILQHIRTGDISLDEVLEKKRNLAADEYVDWIRQHYEALLAEWKEGLGSVDS